MYQASASLRRSAERRTVSKPICRANFSRMDRLHFRAQFTSLATEPIAASRPTRKVLGLPWPQHVTPAERKSLIAGGLGWMLDAMDVLLYSMVLAYLMRDLGMSKATAGLLNSLTLLASAAGGLLFGLSTDRIGRTRALTASILVYSLASGACGLSSTIV